MIDIFIKSYRNDFKWLYYAFKSITKYVSGYNELVIAISKEDSKHFDYKKLPEKSRVVIVDEYGNGYLFQQVVKLQAYKYCNSNFIMFSDSDCIFDHEINLLDFIKNDKPEILYTHYSKVENAIIWKKPTEDFIKRPVEYEMMRRNNQIIHKQTLININEYEKNLEYIVMNSERFSEFNAMCVYAYFYEPDKYTFINTDNWTYVPPKGKQYHSYTEYDKMLKEFSNIVK